MSFIGWVFSLVLLYLAVGRTVFMLIDGIQRRRAESVAPLVAGAVVLALAIPFLLRARPADSGLFSFVVVIAFLWLLWISALSLIMRSRDRPTWQDKKRRKELSKQIKLHLALVTGAIIFSVPFYWLVTTSLKPDERTNVFPPDLIPMQQAKVRIGGENRSVYVLKQGEKEIRVAKTAELENDRWHVARVDNPQQVLSVESKTLRPDLHPVLLWRNYSDALKFLPPEYKHGLKPLWNTIYVTILTIVGTVLSSSLVAYSFARLRWPGRDIMFVVLLATMMIPAAVTMLPVFLIFRSLGWIDTLRPLWFPAIFGSAFNVFLLRQFFMTIPLELEDAAKIDGCGYFTIYWRIMLPLIKPALAAITIFAFMGSWNNFMGPLIYLSSPENMTLAYALQLFQGMHGGEPAMMMAASTLVMLPVLAVFFFTQRYMIQGVTLTGIKG